MIPKYCFVKVNISFLFTFQKEKNQQKRNIQQNINPRILLRSFSEKWRIFIPDIKATKF